jgi:hypothetical protein
MTVTYDHLRRRDVDERERQALLEGSFRSSASRAWAILRAVAGSRTRGSREPSGAAASVTASSLASRSVHASLM